MRKDAELDLEATVDCTVELPDDTRFDEALAIVEDEHEDWLAEEGRVNLAFGETPDGETWEIKGVGVRIALDT